MDPEYYDNKLNYQQRQDAVLPSAAFQQPAYHRQPPPPLPPLPSSSLSSSSAAAAVASSAQCPGDEYEEIREQVRRFFCPIFRPWPNSKKQEQNDQVIKCIIR
jgi:hypothetical protein